MKKWLLISMLIISTSSLLCAEKYALVIAIGDYPEESGWPDISSSNDVVHVKSALKKLGFAEDNIELLLDADATKANIIAAINGIYKKLNQGDIVFIHFSGHGQQVYDDNNDEIDLLDESIVPFDSPIDYEKDVYEGQNLIRDDLIGSLTDKIRARCGSNGQVILVLDSCHSGSGTRGFGKSRGTTKLMAPDNFKTLKAKKDDQMGITKNHDNSWAPIISFFGASARELNYEALDDQSKPVGSLTFSLYSILANLKSDYSCSDIFQKVKMKMKIIAPRQNPQWEGPSDVFFLGGSFIKASEEYPITNIISPYEVSIDIGTIAEIYPGTKVVLYSKDRNEPIGEGTISSAALNKSVIMLVEKVEIKKDELVVVQIKEKAFPPIKCAVHFDLDKASPWNEISEQLANESMIQSVDLNAELIISECLDDSAIQLATYDGTILFSNGLTNARKNFVELELKKKIRNYLQGEFIKSFETEISPYNYKVELLKVDVNDESQILKNFSATENVQLEIGDNIKIKITNTGKRSSYFSLVDIQPDNAVNILIPAASLGYTSEEYYLEPGDSYVTDYVIEIAEPCGMEVLKLICTKEPLDLSAVLNSDRTSTRGFENSNSLEQLISIDNGEVNTRGGKIKSKPTTDYGVTSFFFDIIK